ncbi:MAG: hypothetical protein QMD04_08710 [Anaerolineales bacterium]|nr:hypothetical protein [Anaerolineales bacterium]
MNIGILAARKDKALARIAAAAPDLGLQYRVPEDLLKRLTAENKDREVEAMERLEATAELIEVLAQATPEKAQTEPDKPARPKAERK